MKVVLKNHQDFQSVSEILRLFFLSISKPEGNVISIEDEQNELLKQNTEIVMFSTLDREVTKEQMRNQTDKTEIFVSSWIDVNTSGKNESSAIGNDLNDVDDHLLYENTNDLDRGEISEIVLNQNDLNISAKVIPSAIRREIKRQMYYLLSNFCKIKYPWGSLTGVRPTQIAYRCYEKADKLLENLNPTTQTKQELFPDGYGEKVTELLKTSESKTNSLNKKAYDLAKNDLIDNWFLMPEKAEIGLKTALAKMDVLRNFRSKTCVDSSNQDLPMLYIGVPFCTTRCAYCSFITQDAVGQSKHLENYTTALIQEIREISKFFKEKEKPFQAIYMGGGTPTALPDECFVQVMQAIKEDIYKTDDCEITIEAGRPDSITKTKLEAIQILSEARICINPQTMHDRTLIQIGRDHTVANVYESFSQARATGFDSINMDLILGLPGETGDDFIESLDKIIELNPESITIHTMALKRSAFLEQQHSDQYLKLRFPDQELSEAFATAIAKLQNQGYEPYYLYRQKNVRGGLENIGFTKSGHACVYNVGMMSDQISVVGLGSGSSSKLVERDRVERFYNPKDLANYIQRIDDLIERKIKFFGT